jgi:TRAP-type C4-dicarboxylate transport system permease large subunit
MIDVFSALVVVVPLILPLAEAYDIHPIHLGIIFLANLGIGYSTPPVGMNLFIASFRFGQPILRLYYASLPFLVILLMGLILITYFPSLTLLFID